MVSRQPPTFDQARDSLESVADWLSGGDEPARSVIAGAVRTSARYLAGAYPGGAVEVRIPPFVAIQCIEGLTHKRGTPPNVIEMDPRTWLELAAGALSWDEAVDQARLRTSGSRATLAELLPIRQLPVS